MAEETTASSAPEETSPAPEVAGAENGGNESSAAAEAGANNQVENANVANAAAGNPDAAGGESQQQAPPAAAAAAAGAVVPPEEEAAPDAAAGAPIPALANDLATYFATLQTALQRQMSSGSHNNSATGGGGRSSMVSILWEGVAPITAAGNVSGRNVFLAFETTNFASSGAGGVGSGRPAMSNQQAALYLYAVSQNIVGLEAAVLGSLPPSMYAASAGMDGMGPSNVGGVGGGVTAKQVAEIVSAVSIAATFCNSRSIITQSGILHALVHLIDSTGTIHPPPTAYMKKKSKNGNRGGGFSSSGGVLHALTPFHAEFLQCSLLAGHYRYASTFLAARPTSHTTLDFPYLRLDPTSYLRTHYYAGLVHMGCSDWNSALDSFHLCLTMPCSSVSAITVAARKKSLLVQCLLLESEELDGNTGGEGSTKSNEQGRSGGGSGGSGKSQKSTLENKVLDLPGAASAAVNKYMAASTNRVGGSGGGSAAASAGSGSGSAPERTAGSETSEQPSGRSRRRVRATTSNSSSEAGGGERGGGGGGPTLEGPGGRSNKTSHLGSYHDLVSTYINGNAAHYAKLLTEMTELLHSDGNWGLAKQLEGRLAYRAIRKVASVYSVVGVDVLEEEMAKVCSNLAESGSVGEVVGKRGVEDLLMGMAATDAKEALLADPFVAKIDQSTGMASFLDCDDDESSDDDDSHEEWMEADLSKRLQSCIALAERVRDLDISLTTSPKYQQHAMKEMMMKGDSRASAMMKQQGGGASVADIGHGPMDIGVDW